eukprot:scaffold7308_cov114-Isochrysis_galbana.AAC.4
MGMGGVCDGHAPTPASKGATSDQTRPGTAIATRYSLAARNYECGSKQSRRQATSNPVPVRLTTGAAYGPRGRTGTAADTGHKLAQASRESARQREWGEGGRREEGRGVRGERWRLSDDRYAYMRNRRSIRARAGAPRTPPLLQCTSRGVTPANTTGHSRDSFLRSGRRTRREHETRTIRSGAHCLLHIGKTLTPPRSAPPPPPVRPLPPSALTSAPPPAAASAPPMRR